MPGTKELIVILNLSFLLCFVFFSTVYSQHLEASSYFPLKIGNQWVYSSQIDTLTESVADTQRIEGNLYYSFEKFRDFHGFLFRIYEDSVFIYADTAKYLWYDFNADSGDTWIVPLLGHPYYGGVFTMQSKTDTVVTPAEIFIDCYRIHHFIGADAEFVEWFAPGVGIVKRDVITIAGLRRWVLVDRIITSVRTSRDIVIPKLYSLAQNYPNPFNPTTKVKYSIPAVGPQHAVSVQIIIYDVLGSEIATLVNEEKPAGSYEVEWIASNVPSGVYFYRLQIYPANGRAGSFIATKKMLLMK